MTYYFIFLLDKIKRLTRWLQGESIGMSAGSVTFSRKISRSESILAPTITISNQVRVPDVSYYQEWINFVQMKDVGAAGVIIRAGQRNWVDTKFVENWSLAKAAGLPRGSYWLYDSRATPESQAALWWSQLENDPPELVLAADFEESYGGGYGTKAHFKKFIQEIQRLSGLPNARIVCYTSYYYWLERVGNDVFFAAYGLWLAWYNVMSIVKVPLPWSESDLIFWQDTSHGDGTVYGVSSLNIDLSWYYSDLENFRARFNLDGGETMSIYTVHPKSNDTKIFKNPDGSGTNIDSNWDMGEAAKGDFINGYGYMHLYKMVNTDIDGYVSLTKINYTVDAPPSGSSASASVSPSPSASPSAGPEDVTDIHITYTNGEPSEVVVDGIPWVSP